MDAYYTSHLELFFKLIGLHDVVIGACVPFSLEKYYLSSIEYREHRMLLSSWCTRPCPDDTDCQQWRPEWFNGLPQRIFFLKNQLVISATMPETSDARYWYRQYKKQQMFLKQQIEGFSWK